MIDYVKKIKNYINFFLLFVVIIIFFFSSRFGKYIYSGVVRNIANREVFSNYLHDKNSCDSINQEKGINLYRDSLDVSPGSYLTWRSFAFENGIRDRVWLTNQIKKLMKQGKNEWIDQFIFYNEIPAWAIQINWSTQRCLLEWKAFNLGLVYSAQGKWQNAITYYQIGIALSSGSIRPDILTEYYNALANFILEDNQPANRLAAAKYYALAGNREAAKSIFSKLKNSNELSSFQYCDALLGDQWVSNENLDIDLIPWPTHLGENGECLSKPGNDITPEWTLNKENKYYTDNKGRILLGFDADHDILNGGAEVIGKLYWKTVDGNIDIEAFREHNLWPNSGNDWMSSKGFWQCLPGYYEAAWIFPCASNVSSGLNDGRGNIGNLIERESDGPDSNLITGTKWIPKNRIIIGGGNWKISGDLVSPQISKEYKNGNPPRYYDVIINLSNYPKDTWFSKVSFVDPLISDYEYSFWIRPRMGKGKGNIEFDNLFLFFLTEN